MSAYKRMRVVELQQACQTLGIRHEGLNRRGLMNALRNREENGGEQEYAGGGVEPDDEVTFRVGGETSHSVDTADALQTALDRGTDGTESEELSVMRLRLALVQEERLRERERDERAMEMREREWSIEKERAEMQVGQHAPATRPTVRGEMYHILPKLDDSDALVFFTAFERSLQLNSVDKADWTKYLGSCLTSKANKVLAGLSLAQNRDYDECKQAILSYYRLDAAAYLKKFRQAKRGQDETYRMFKARLLDYYTYYANSKDLQSFEGLMDDIVCEQLLSTMSPEVRSFVLSKQAKTADESCTFADLHAEMSRTSIGAPAAGNTQTSGTFPPKAKGSNNPAGGPPLFNVSNGVYRASAKPGNVTQPVKPVRCYMCNAIGHKKQDCPLQSRPAAGICVRCQNFHPAHVPCFARSEAGVYATALNESVSVNEWNNNVHVPHGYLVPVTVNGSNISILRDTGCSPTMIINPLFVNINEADYTGEEWLAYGAFDDQQSPHRIPLARVSMLAPSLGTTGSIQVTVGVSNLPNNIQGLIGNAFFAEHPYLCDVINRTPINGTGVMGSQQRSVGRYGELIYAQPPGDNTFAKPNLPDRHHRDRGGGTVTHSAHGARSTRVNDALLHTGGAGRPRTDGAIAKRLSSHGAHDSEIVNTSNTCAGDRFSDGGGTLNGRARPIGDGFNCVQQPMTGAREPGGHGEMLARSASNASETVNNVTENVSERRETDGAIGITETTISDVNTEVDAGSRHGDYFAAATATKSINVWAASGGAALAADTYMDGQMTGSDVEPETLSPIGQATGSRVQNLTGGLTGIVRASDTETDTDGTPEVVRAGVPDGSADDALRRNVDANSTAQTSDLALMDVQSDVVNRRGDLGSQDGGETVVKAVDVVLTRSAAARAAAEVTERDTVYTEQNINKTATAGNHMSSETDYALQDLARIDISDIQHEDVTQTETHGDANRDRAQRFKLDQQTDGGLQVYWTRAKLGSTEFTIRSDLLYRRASMHSGVTNDGYVLVLPRSHESETIRLAHDSLLGGHLGTRKTFQRISGEYFFPKMKRKVTQYVRACHHCQMTRGVKVADRQPLQPIEVIEAEAFQHITVDFVGSNLPTTTRKNKHILVIVCNATNYLTALPLKNCKAETVADELLRFFCDKGFCQTITSDNAGSFKAELLAAVEKKLGIQAKFSAPFHPASHGRVEKMNGSLLQMIRKFCYDEFIDWDLKLPYFCFALNEVPNCSSLISPFELIYGRKARGLLAVVRSELEGGEQGQQVLKMPVSRYLETLSQRIRAGLKAASQNTRTSQLRNKALYDKRSTVRSLEPGQDVLVLMPSHPSKIRARWCGPYKTLRKLPNNNYVLDIDGREAFLHINMLRRYETQTDEYQNVPNQVQTERSQAVTISVVVDGRTDALQEAMDGAGEPTDQPGSVDEFMTGDQTAPHAGVDQVTICEQLTAPQQETIKRLVDEFSDLFTGRLGRTHLTQHTIRVTDDLPCWQQSYPIPAALREPVERELAAMEASGVIEHDPHARNNSPLVIVRKAGGGIRLCQNYINLNKKTIPEFCDMTNMNELIGRVAGARFLTKADLKSSYFQIPMDPASEKLTSFQTPFGTFKYKMMPQGLVNSGATLQRLMNQILRGCHRYADKLLDDVIVWSDDFDLHVTQVADVFSRIRAAGLTLNAAKTHIATNKLHIFGYLLDNGEILPDPDKIKAVMEWPQPKTKKQLSSFTGLCGYFRSSIANYAEIALPLTNLLGRYKPEKIPWGTEQQAAFDALKSALVAKPVLYPPDLNKPFELWADASQSTISSILMQTGNDVNGTPKVVSYASRKLLSRECKYSVVEREVLSIVHGLSKFKTWIYGSRWPIVVKSDHRPLLFLNRMVKTSPRLARWALAIQEYNLDMQWVKGKNQLADAFTRLDG